MCPLIVNKDVISLCLKNVATYPLDRSRSQNSLIIASKRLLRVGTKLGEESNSNSIYRKFYKLILSFSVEILKNYAS